MKQGVRHQLDRFPILLDGYMSVSGHAITVVPNGQQDDCTGIFWRFAVVQHETILSALA